MPYHTLKISDDQLKALGGNIAAASTKLDELITTAALPKETVSVIAFDDVKKMFSGFSAKCDEDLAAMGASLAGLKTQVESINPEAILKTAKDAASLQAASALSAVGQNPVAPAPLATGNEGVTSTAEALIKSGDYEAAYKASESIRNEFSSPKTYAAYMRAQTKGMVSEYQPRSK